MSEDALVSWLEQALGRRPVDPAPFIRALTHGSHPSGESYERLEFLGDRVLGLVMADWLYALFPNEPEGKLSRRLNALVSGETCAEIARSMSVGAHVRLGKQARDDGASDSDYVLGDVVEALIGALFLEGGLEAARDFVRRHWADLVEHQDRAPKHPKSALQEWAAEKGFRPPVYALVGRAGPHHAPRFTVSVEIPGRATASAEGTSKQEAETAAARALLGEVGR
ncbi:ribonuclease III [Sphingomonas quercus]|uniref:Ribonuclease 3 n=1 Tax=Sphingomonas quercus TaxID=2842451 RepID=A0ABS6BLL8_9SPHN|nr:ribonuclease III [Sphingomonas quercus]MBU3079201.1 ribonuclease III [Sphingomonas quercus]